MGRVNADSWQRIREAEHRRHWAGMKEAVERGDLLAFHRLYAAYLEWANIISPGRQLLHAATLATARELARLYAVEKEGTHGQTIPGGVEGHACQQPGVVDAADRTARTTDVR